MLVLQVRKAEAYNFQTMLQAAGLIFLYPRGTKSQQDTDGLLQMLTEKAKNITFSIMVLKGWGGILTERE